MESVLNVKLRICSQIDNLDDNGLTEGESEVTESTVHGIFNQKTRTLSYDERAEDGSVVHCTVMENGSTVCVSRTGAVLADMIFEEGRTHASLYRIPPYSFDMQITAKRIRGELSLGKDLILVYNMEIGGAKKACRMKIALSGEEA